MQAYFDAGATRLAMEFESTVKGPNCMSICVAVASGEIDAQTAAELYDQDCFNQAIQFGFSW
jgi:raffinose/stachyose/melibiose transport system substrate-binding protein